MTSPASRPDRSPSAPDAALLRLLAEAVPGGVSTDPADRAAHDGDAMVRAPAGAGCAAVVSPRSTAEVSALLRLCHEHALAVVPQGGLTGYCGGATPLAGSIALSLRRMSRIEAIDRDAATVTVEAGAPLQAVQEAARRAGLFYPVDFGARGSCTIGGTIATNAGGNRVLRYGMTRDAVLGLEVVLADGTVVDAMNTMLKNNTGYDLKQVFFGSEGTLGVVTRAVCRLAPEPTSLCAALCGLPDFDAVLRLLRHCRAGLGPTLSAFEVMWPDFLDLALAARGRPSPLAGRHGIYVLLDVLGQDQERDQALFESVIGEAFEAGILEDAALSQSIAQAEDFWSIREATAEFGHVVGPRVPFDVSVPTPEIGAFAEECRARLSARWPNVRCLAFGHVADGNLHLVAGLDDGMEADEVKAIVNEIVRERRGSVSAEHGIGTAKAAYLPYSRTAPELDLMRRLKAMLDPRAILNPGKVLAAS